MLLLLVGGNYHESFEDELVVVFEYSALEDVDGHLEVTEHNLTAGSLCFMKLTLMVRSTIKSSMYPLNFGSTRLKFYIALKKVS